MGEDKADGTVETKDGVEKEVAKPADNKAGVGETDGDKKEAETEDKADGTVETKDGVEKEVAKPADEKAVVTGSMKLSFGDNAAAVTDPQVKQGVEKGIAV